MAYALKLTKQEVEYGCIWIKAMKRMTMRQVRRRLHCRAIAVIAICFCLLLARTALSQKVAADLILHDGHVWTVDPRRPEAQAVAIREGRIIKVGADREVMRLRGAETKVIDLKGQMVLPGFNDAHTHFENAVEWFFQVLMMDVATQDELLKRLKVAATRVPGDLWITGGDWDAFAGWTAEKRKDTTFKPFDPDLAAMDVVSGPHPVLFRRYDHVYFANSKALALARITERTIDPKGGHYDRDPRTRRLNGMLYGTAGEQMEKLLPPLSDAQKLIGAKGVVRQFNEVGITSIQDIARVDPIAQEHIFPTYAQRSYSDMRVFWNLRKAGGLLVRVYPLLPLTTWADLRKFGIGPGSGDNMIHYGALKDFTDGSYMLTPYVNRPDSSGDWSYRFVGEDVIRKNIIDADRAGFDIGVHVIGDKALRELLGWYEDAIKINGPRDRRFRLIHAQFASPEDLKHAGRLHMIVDVTPYQLLAKPEPIEQMLGPERAKWAFAWRTMIDNWARLDLVSDMPGLYNKQEISPFDPLMNMYAAITRRTPEGEPPNGWHPEQSMTIREAIEAYTINPAYASHDERRKGSITEGKLADLVVLSHDIVHGEPEDLLKAKVMYTILGGRIVYQRGVEGITDLLKHSRTRHQLSKQLKHCASTQTNKPRR